MGRILALALLPLVGCSSWFGSRDAAPANPPVLAADKGRIFFFRTGRTVSKKVRPSIQLNGEVVGKMGPGMWLFVDRSPGDYEANSDVANDHGVKISLEAGQTVYVEIRMLMGDYAGHVLPTVVSEGVGKCGVARATLGG